MKKKLFSIAASLAFLIGGLSFFFPKPFYFLDAKWTDQYFQFRGPLVPQNRVALVVIDEKSLTRLGRWPWPRATMARLVDQLKISGAKVIGFDITFSETSSDDKILARALQKTPDTILGYFFYPSQNEFSEAAMGQKEILENDQTIFPSSLSLSSKQLESSGKKVFGVQANVPEITKALGGEHQGFFNVFPDLDGTIRSLPLVLFYKGKAYPSLALQMASAATGFSPVPLFDKQGTLEGLALGNTKIPLNETGELFINYRGPSKTFPHISIADILDGKISADQLKNKVVLIGATATGIYDMRVTPVSPTFAGLEIQASALDNILSGDFLIANTAGTKTVSIFLLIFFGLLLGIVISRFSALNSFFVFLFLTGLLLGGGYFFFLKKGLILHTLTPALNGLLVYGGMTIYRYFAEEREKQRVRKTFQFYLSPAVIKVILENPKALKLGGDRKELSVLFSDIRDFTPKSEKLPPEKVVQLLNDYFTVMTDIIFKYDGTLDKFMGDAIMAIFGAPLEQKDHALRASLVALEMIEALEQHKKEWCQKYGLDDFKIGVGIHTGVMAVGNMGSLKRFNYTVIGDSVNLASRLETLTKEYNVPILISGAHYKLVKENIIAKELGAVRVKGKEEETVIYSLTGKR